ncbi:hypothetical protein O0L34_g18177 [Tuta absoluta]|nr:hypothetical protein O0L34_g18177 [Tuta absoluta]
MANVKNNSGRRGRKPKLLTGAGGVIKKHVKSSENGHNLRSAPFNDNTDNKPVLLTKGIITRSGRIRKKSKDKLKVMDNILKSELMIADTRSKRKKTPDSPTSNGNNNNDFEVSDQNNIEINVPLILPQHTESSPKKINRKSPKNNSISENQSNLVGKIRVARNIFQKSENGVQKDSNDYLLGPKENGNLKMTMDSNLRDDVISNMKSVLSPDNEIILPEKEPKKYVRKRSKPTKNPVINTKENKKTANKNKEIVEPTPDPSKTKQVRLSNGVVLTLSLVQCDHCQKSFSNKASLSRHMLSHFDLRRHQCKHCPRKFRYRTTLKLHIQRRHPVTENVEFYVCQICDKNFQLEENLELHLASHIKSETNNYKCLYCEKKFSYRLLLLQHEKSHLDTGRFKCFTCEMTYDSRSRLSQHIKTHSKVKDYICQYCGKEFQRLNSIKRHVRVCHGGQTIKCPICFKDLKGHLTEHMRVHNQNRPHICPDCGQRFTQSTQLKVHRRSHTGDRPYPCRICNRRFGHSNALLLHVRRHTGEKPFPCAMCHMSFSQLPHMKNHMRKIHGKDSAYKCQKCGEFFKLKAELESHGKGCTVGDKVLSFEEQIQASVQVEEVELDSSMKLSKMRFLLALLLTMIASKEKLKYLGFNKRLIDDLLVESLEAMGHVPCKDDTLTPYKRLKTNVEILLGGTIPSHQMEKFRSENKSTEELLVLLTDEKKIV